MTDESPNEDDVSQPPADDSVPEPDEVGGFNFDHSPPSDSAESAAEQDRDTGAAVSTSEFAALSGFKRDLLVVIAGVDAPKGLDLKSELEEYYEGTVNHGRLYPNLDSLVDAGFIEKRALDKRSNAYELTSRGRNHLRARREWVEAHSAASSVAASETPGSSETGHADTPDTAGSGDAQAVGESQGTATPEREAAAGGTEEQASESAVLDEIEREFTEIDLQDTEN